MKIIRTSFKRYMENGIMRHSIELHLDGKISPLGLGPKQIRKLLKKN